ncbi:hypothetical protein CL673_09620 [Candidatus Bathyarchaeota archaeon]|nr:hypothetical protein [Candidatus Bathyarchaeota archaeon]MDP6049355.1 hypothetical protein [Candidatus Bathyarchaeota archaeon]MDP7207994.1 hypothetical protein [Candidatus Bathyarchaeota archaeon]MDP7442957.1 hypothetical protein [Candidatus Bathyarchaeota archaeon]|tara:strand:+ start:4430 stop:4660 length:231 start_codon:yes stop_codon:yes gene_type:complete
MASDCIVPFREWSLTAHMFALPPRLYCMFPWGLGHFIREKDMLELHEAVMNMTSLPTRTVDFTTEGSSPGGCERLS